MFRCMHLLDRSWLGFLRVCVGIFLFSMPRTPTQDASQIPTELTDTEKMQLAINLVDEIIKAQNT